MNKTSVLILFSLLTLAQSAEAQTCSGKLIVSVTGFRNNNGKVLVAIYNSPDGYPGEREKSVVNVKADIKDNSCVLEFGDLPYGTYAIAIVHDENNNSQMDFGLFGINKEGYGASNNAKANFGPPSYNDAKFTFTSSNCNANIRISY